MITDNIMLLHRNAQQGFALLPVAIVIAVMASIALLINSQSAMNVINVESQNEKYEVKYLAQAGFEHASWVANNSGCAGYSLPVTSLGQNSYTAIYTPADDSPVTIAATGTLSNGVTHTVTGTNIPVYNPMTQTVILQPGSEGIDSFIEGDSGHQNHNKETDKDLKIDSENNKNYRTLIQFDLSSIPTTAKLDSAVLEMYLHSSTGANDVVEAHALTRSWTENGVTWNDYNGSNSWNTKGGDYDTDVAGAFTASSVGWKALDVTNLAQAWVTNNVSNYGMILLSPSASGNNEKKFHSSDAADSSLHPKFTITYRCECGVGPCAAPPSNEPIAHWKFDENSGFTAVDSEGGHDGTLINGASWVSGRVDGGLLFDGNNDYVEVPHDNNLLLTEGMTFSAWASTLDISGGYKAIISKDDSGNGASNYWFGIDEDELVFGFWVSGNFRTIRTSTANLNAGNWYHLVASFDNTSDEVRLYVDGAQVHMGSFNFEPTTETSDLLIGRSVDGENWDGVLDDVRIYNRALAQEEIEELAKTPISAPIAHWKLDESAGVIAVDSIGSHDGELNNGPVWTVDGKVDGALQFDGVNDEIEIAHDDALSLTSELTISAWVRNDSPSILGSYRVLSKESVGANDNYWLSFQSKTLWVGIGGNLFPAPNTFEPDIWYHIAVSFDDVADQLVIYVNGVAVSNVTTTATITPNKEPLYIGSNWEGIKFWVGLLDDVRIYNTALSASEIIELASSGGEGGGGGGGEPPPEPSCSGDFLDEFNARSYSGSDGTLKWSTDWLEINESNGATSGDEQVRSDLGRDYVLRVRDNDSGGEGVEREADLSFYTSATLSFLYSRASLDNLNDYVSIEISSNGGSTWDEIDRIEGPADDSSYLTFSQDISKFISSNTRIRFISSSTLGNTDEVYFDDVQIEVSGCAK